MHPRYVRYMRDDFTCVFVVAGCFETTITDREARELSIHRGFARLAIERMLPFVWLAMPGHEDRVESVVYR